jgi:hypothetical protein
MSTVVVVVIVIVVIAVIGVVAYFAQAQARRRSLQQRFGPEYDRTVKSHDNTREAEQELLARKKRHDELEIHPLDPAARERHLAEWRQVQERFVDAPETAVTEADRLLILVMGERGYPTEGYEQQVADLSVEHAGTIDRYRKAHDISARAETKKASTEDLRQAMVHYRSLFNELLETGEDETAAGGRASDRTATGTNGSGPAAGTTTGTAAGTTTGSAARTDAADESAGVTEPGTSETGAAEHAGTGEEAAPQAAAGTESEATAERARTGARNGRRTARRDNEDEGA